MSLIRRYFVGHSERGNVDSRGVFFRMLRPELVRSFRLPLSSDTFTGFVPQKNYVPLCIFKSVLFRRSSRWGMYDDNRAAYELDVREATNLVVEQRILELAAEIDEI